MGRFPKPTVPVVCILVFCLGLTALEPLHCSDIGIRISPALTLPLAELLGPEPGALGNLWMFVASKCITLFPYTILGAVILANVCSTRNWKDTSE